MNGQTISLHYSPKSLMDAKWWSIGTKGQNDEDGDRLGSAINLYDNRLILPEQGKRKVLVRHLDIESNRTISSTIVDPNRTLTGNDQATLTDGNGNIKTSAGVNGKVTSNRAPYPEFQEVYADIMSEHNYVDADDGIKIDVLSLQDYECVGYNTDCNVSFDLGRNSRNNKIANGYFVPIGNANQVFVSPNSNKVDDFVFVDIYYRKRDKLPRTVLVRHIDIAKNETISTEIISGAGFIPDAAKLTRTLSTGASITSQNALYPEFQEVWVIQGNATMTGNETMTIKSGTPTPATAPFESSSISSIYKYRGYIATSSTNQNYEAAFYSALGARETKIASKVYDSTSTFKTLSARAGESQYQNIFEMIDFYYSSNPPILKLQLKPLIGTIKYAKAGDSPFTETEERAIVPSGENIRVGDVGAYKYMLAGIEVKKNEVAEDRTYNITHAVTRTASFEYKKYVCATGEHSWDYNPGTHTHSRRVETPCEEGVAGTCYTTVYDPIPVHIETWKSTTTQSQSKGWTYKVPVKYTYYTVPNMKVFTINRLEIYNKKGTSNTTGLPLLYKDGLSDDSDYKLYTTDEYKSTVKTKITNVLDNEITSASVLNRSNYESVAKNGTNIWIDSSNEGTISKYKNSTYILAKLLVNNDLENAATLRINAQTNKSVAEATNSTVSFKVQNTAISIAGVNMVDGKRIDRVADLANFDANGLIPNSVDTSSGAYKQIEYNGKNYLDYATDYPNVNNSDNKISSHYYPSFSKTNMTEWANNIFNIPTLRLNGDRLIKAKIYYSIDDRNTINTNPEGAFKNEFLDTEWKDVSSDDNIAPTTENPLGKTLVDGPKTGAFLDRSVIYQGAGYGERQVQLANVFTPISAKGNIESTGGLPYIDHTSQGDVTNSGVIQKNARFKIVCSPNVHSYYGALTSNKVGTYIKSYYIKFDFDVENVKIADKYLHRLGQIIPAYTWIGPVSKAENYITAQAVRNPDTQNQNAVFLAETNKIWIMSIASNVPSTPTSPANLAADIASGVVTQNSFVEQGQNNALQSTGFNGSSILKSKYYGRIDITNVSNYAAISSQIVSTNLSRMFDFKITDVKDIAWKSVFRKTENNNTNVHTGNVYYSGIKKWNFYSLDLNEMLSRTTSEIGTSPKRTLPIGPYKNTNTGYTKAPKLGYRFSFDLKTTGRIPDASTTNRKVEIVPSFYYISKDASKFLMADTFITNKKIKLFYKNSNGIYVEIGSNQDTYKLSFVPKDGYRYIDKNLYAYDSSNMLTTTKSLGGLKKLLLDKDVMAISNGGFVQTWYGEYKLPNSTIAVEVTKDSSGKEIYDINKPLNDGYIGVIFDIEATIKEDASIKIKYDVNNKNTFDNANTSQWDYEGHMDFVKGSTVRLKLEKATWSLSNDIYNKVKGTVILYDTDARAANDFE